MADDLQPSAPMVQAGATMLNLLIDDLAAGKLSAESVAAAVWLVMHAIGRLRAEADQAARRPNG